MIAGSFHLDTTTTIGFWHTWRYYLLLAIVDFVLDDWSATNKGALGYSETFFVLKLFLDDLVVIDAHVDEGLVVLFAQNIDNFHDFFLAIFHFFTFLGEPLKCFSQVILVNYLVIFFADFDDISGDVEYYTI